MTTVVERGAKVVLREKALAGREAAR